MKIDSAIKKDNFITISNNKKVLITFSDFYRKYRKYYEVARSSILTIQPFDGIFPDKLEEQIFVKQLIDIGDVNIDDIEEIANFTRFKLQIKNSLDVWYQKGEITREELNGFKKEAIAQWRNEFKPKYRSNIDEKEINGIALNILDKFGHHMFSGLLCLLHNNGDDKYSFLLVFELLH